MPPTIIAQPPSLSVKLGSTFTLTVGVNQIPPSDPFPAPGPALYYDFRITYDWQYRIAGTPGWISSNRTVTKNTAIPSTWGSSSPNSVFSDSLSLPATAARNGRLFRCIITYRIRYKGSTKDISVTTLTSNNATIIVTNRQHIFNINSFNNIPSNFVTYKNALIAAANRWNNLVRIPDFLIEEYPAYEGVRLVNFSTTSDPAATWIAQTLVHQDAIIYYSWAPGVQTTRKPPKFSTKFSLELNSSKFIGLAPSNYTYNDWVNILTHELGHALGIGGLTLPDVRISFTSTDGRCAGTPIFNLGDFPRLIPSEYPFAATAYNRIANNRPVGTRHFVPVESTGSAGSALKHWENNYRPRSSVQTCFDAVTPNAAFVYYLDRPDANGIVNEMMVKTYIRDNNPIITDLSIGLLRDFGYVEVSPGARESGNIITDNGSTPGLINPQSLCDNFCKSCG